MGNRSSSVQPAGPPPLLTAAVMGDLSKFQEEWNGADSVQVLDRQDNNVLHALCSCRGREGAQCEEILNQIHASLSTKAQIQNAYQAKNSLGCTPLWILVAYGNVDLLKHVQEKFAAIDSSVLFQDMLRVPNHQGDSPFLATCSMGNTDMIRFLKQEILTPEQFTTALTASNQKGTTPLQIIVGNSHLTLLQLVLQEGDSSVEKQLMQLNAAGLSLFHICSERNAHDALQALLSFMIDNKAADDKKSDVETLDQVLALKDKNGANAIHVAAFCGNKETVQLWIDVIQKACAANNNDKTNAVDLLDKMDGQARTPYWLAMVQGKDAVGALLADVGVDTEHPNMVKEIKEAQEQRQARQQQRPQPVDGSALLGR